MTDKDINPWPWPQSNHYAFKAKRNGLWKWVRDKKDEFLNLPPGEVDFDFWTYLDVNYGVVPIRDAAGMITDQYKITDEEKFFMAKLSGLDI